MLIRACKPTDLASICDVINDAAVAYRGVIAPDRWKDPHMPLLHLYAIERVVYQNLGLTSVLEGIKQRERKFPSWNDQQEAIDIVDAETAQAFVGDLRP